MVRKMATLTVRVNRLHSVCARYKFHVVSNQRLRKSVFLRNTDRPIFGLQKFGRAEQVAVKHSIPYLGPIDIVWYFSLPCVQDPLVDPDVRVFFKIHDNRGICHTEFTILLNLKY